MIAIQIALYFLVPLCIVLGLFFAVNRRAAGGKYFDETVSNKNLTDRLNGLTDAEKRVHLWVTRRIDSLFPAVYAALLSSLTILSSGPERIIFVCPALLAAVADYLENRTIIVALETGVVPRLKSLFSLLKFGFLVIAVVIVIGVDYTNSG